MFERFNKTHNEASRILSNWLNAEPSVSAPKELKSFPTMVVSPAEEIAAWNAKVVEKKQERAQRRLLKKMNSVG